MHKIYIAGHQGMVGSAICDPSWSGDYGLRICCSELMLSSTSPVRRWFGHFFEDEKPTGVDLMVVKDLCLLRS